jgi:uncharacterized protein
METANTDLSFNVAQLLKESVGSTRKLDIGTPTLLLDGQEGRSAGADMLEARDLKGNVKLTRLSQDLLVQGQVGAEVRMQCSRCLDEFTVPVEASLEEKYQPTIDIETGRPIRREEYEEDDTAFSINASHEIDLAEPVRQALLVALPLKPLCREDCAGLCPHCGANLNEGPCACEPDTTDNRWAALRELQLEDLPSGEPNRN